MVLGSAPGPIRVPGAPPAPTPAPSPDGAVSLAADQLFVIDSDIPVLVLASPKGLVSITEEAGPVKVRGRFVDGTGVETRTFKGKSVVTVEAIAAGRCELLVVPVGAAKGEQVIRRTIDVNGGQGPIPPPTPEPKPPNPKPLDPAPIPEIGLRVLIVYETSVPLPQGQVTILYGQTVRDFLNNNCVAGPTGRKEWRVWDKDITGLENESTIWRNVMNLKRDSVPWLVVSNGKTGFQGPLPADADAFTTLVAKYK